MNRAMRFPNAVRFGGQQQSMEYWQKQKTRYGANLIAGWMADETSGSTALDFSGNNRNGTYAANITLAEYDSFIRGKKIAGMHANTQINVYSTSLRDAINVSEGMFSFWLRVNDPADWADGAVKLVGKFYLDATGRGIGIQTNAPNYKLSIAYGGVTADAPSFYVYPFGTTFVNIGIAYSETGNVVRYYQNGVKVKEFAFAGLGRLPVIDNARLGAYNAGGLFPWKGAVGGFVLNRLPTDAEVEVSYTDAVGAGERWTFIGDSITDPITMGVPTWATQLAAVRGGYPLVHNRALSGTQIRNGGMAAQVAAAANDNANRIWIAIGTNDDNASDMVSLKTIIGTQIDALRVSNPNAAIRYLNLFPRWTDTGGGTIQDKANIRTAIAEICATKNVPCQSTIDWFTAAQTVDGLHPNVAGHTAIATRELAVGF